MDRGAWWAAVYGVAQSQTRLKRLSSSSVKAKSACSELLVAISFVVLKVGWGKRNILQGHPSSSKKKKHHKKTPLLLLSRFSRVLLCATP